MIRVLLALIMLMFVTPTPAQSPPDSDYKLTVDVQLVQLPVSVLDKKGNPFQGLQQEHFAIYEDKILQNIALFKQEDVPLSLGLVIDASDSMRDKLEKVNAAAMTFIRERNPEDETSIVSFGHNVFLEQAFTREVPELEQALTAMSAQGTTALYDAIVLAAKYVEHKGTNDKKVLIVVSDGQDNRSRNTLEDVLKAVGESQITLYTIGLLSPQTAYVLGGPKEALRQLAEVTGGASFFPRGVSEVESICLKISRDLRSQYTLGYRSSNVKFDGAWRKVQVKVTPPKDTPKLKLRTKQGYYAPARKRDNTLG